MAPRSLADDLRNRDDAGLVKLLRARPDLVHPIPNDLTALATRATTRASTLRALDQLDRFTLQVVEVLWALPDPTTGKAVEDLLGVDPADALSTLVDQALVWGPADALRLTRTARDMIGDEPAGLGPTVEQALKAYRPSRLARLLADLGLPATADPVAAMQAIAAHLSTPAVLAGLMEQARPPAREVLERLAWGPPTGRLTDADRDISVATARTPVEWLLAHGLLVAADEETVVLPREIALDLRGGRVHVAPEPQPPPHSPTARDPGLVDHTAAGSAFTMVRLVEDLLEAWGVTPPPLLRAGGLGLRDLRRVAAALAVTESEAALVIETAYAAGLLGVSGDAAEVWLPTPAYDDWRDLDTPRRWSRLAHAWLDSSRASGLVGGRNDRDRPFVPLGPDLHRAAATQVRAAVLADIAQLDPGDAAGIDDLLARMRWLKPRHTGTGALTDDLVRWTVREAEQLGITGLGALSSPGRAVLTGDAGDAGAALAPLLPEPLDYVLLQADLTAVAPGPLTRDLAQELALAADVESTGGATVYRFNEASVRRALDAGRNATGLHRLLVNHSRTPVPQPLSYLVDDVARRHGRIRIGVASSYIRCDDESVLDQLLVERRSDQLRLRRLAPTVLVAQAEADLVLEVLRESGYAPMAETPFGDLLVRRPDSRRTPPRQRPPQLAAGPPPPSDPLLVATVRALRAGERAAAFTQRLSEPAGSVDGLPRTSAPVALEILRRAAVEQAAVAIGYVNAEGRASQRVIEPLTVEGGYVSAFDHLRDEIRTFAVHRITGVLPIAHLSPD